MVKNNKHPEQQQVFNIEWSGELLPFTRDLALRLPMKGKVLKPYNQPYDRHDFPKFFQDQTDRAAIAIYRYKGREAFLLKKLSGREYCWAIYGALGEKQYGSCLMDIDNKGDVWALEQLIPKVEETIDYLDGD